MHAQDKTLSFYSKSEVNELIKKLKALKSGESFAHRHAHVTDQAKHFRLMELSDRLTKKFSAGLGNARALAAHRPIYDNAFAGAMAEMDDED